LITIGVDPGTTSTGVAIFKERTANYDELLFSTQGNPTEVIDEAIDIVRSEGEQTKIVAVESLYPGPGRAGPKSIYTLGASTGFIIGTLKHAGVYDENTWLWGPYPVTWRKHIVVPMGGKETTLNAKSREQAADMAIQFAQAVAQDAMLGPRGGPQIDRAMAICIGVSAQIEYTKCRAKATGVEGWMKISSGSKLTK